MRGQFASIYGPLIVIDPGARNHFFPRFPPLNVNRPSPLIYDAYRFSSPPKVISHHCHKVAVQFPAFSAITVSINITLRLYLVAEGHCAYTGSCKNALSFFKSVNYPCPENFNPADHYIFTMAIVPGEEEECKKRVEVSF